MRIALMMEPLQRLNTRTSLPWFLGMEAQKRGFETFYFQIQDITLHNGVVTAPASPIQFTEKNDTLPQLQEPQRIVLNEMDVVLMMPNDPYNIRYITATQMMEHVQRDTFVFADPKAVRFHANKLFMRQFADLMPPTLISCNFEEIANFRDQHGDIIVKPLYDTSSHGVFHIGQSSANLRPFLELQHQQYPCQWMIQKYIPEIRHGDKRLFLLNGEIVSSYNRIPAEGEVRASIFLGAEVVKAEITQRDHEIIERILPTLNQWGFHFVGIDIIGDHLTEVNVESPSGIGYANDLNNNQVEALVWDEILKLKEARHAA